MSQVFDDAVTIDQALAAMREIAYKAYDAGYKARMSSNYVPTKEEFMKQLDI